MRAEAWRKRSALPTLILSLLYTVTYVCPIYFYPVSNSTRIFCNWFNYVIWAYFVFDYGIQFYLSSSRTRFFQRNLLELFLVFVPFFRPVRALRALLFTTKAGARTKKTFINSIPLLVSVTAVLMIVILGAAILDIERFVPNSTIKTPSDALWWGLVTITTIGYGDKYPVTQEGRIVAGILIIFGVAMMTTLTGAFAAWLMSQNEEERQSS